MRTTRFEVVATGFLALDLLFVFFAIRGDHATAVEIVCDALAIPPYILLGPKRHEHFHARDDQMMIRSGNENTALQWQAVERHRNGKTTRPLENARKIAQGSRARQRVRRPETRAVTPAGQ